MRTLLLVAAFCLLAPTALADAEEVPRCFFSYDFQYPRAAVGCEEASRQGILTFDTYDYVKSGGS